ncbi:hypothetical protein TcBrA4_0061570 [Trypanosoma cruzi]|nr:hypothetical protein TcBrA4_0061570 [Trypanosoma cruzi]
MNAAIESYALQLDTINSAIESIDSETTATMSHGKFLNIRRRVNATPQIFPRRTLWTPSHVWRTHSRLSGAGTNFSAKENVTQQKLLNDGPNFC